MLISLVTAFLVRLAWRALAARRAQSSRVVAATARFSTSPEGPR